MKTVLIIIPYEDLYPPMNGGMQRCFHVLHQLSKFYHVTAIIDQDSASFIKAFKDFPALSSIKIFSTKDHSPRAGQISFLPARLDKALRYRWYKRSLTGSADGKFLNYYTLLTEVLSRNKFDFIVLQNLSTINAVSIIRRFDKTAFIIYDTHNVGTLLAEEEYAKGNLRKKDMQAVKKLESGLSNKVNAIWACSDQDLQLFKEMNEDVTGAVIPNGVHLEKKTHADGALVDKPTSIIFCGSLGYEPNYAGLSWFYETIWPVVKNKHPDLQLIVLGSGKLPAAFAFLYHVKDFVFTGAVADVKEWYNKAAVAIVPLKSGSGTRLKILEAMGLGVPVLSTSKGAEGINFIQGEHIEIADDEKLFAEKLTGLLEDKNTRMHLQIGARKLVEHEYDWDVIGNKIQKFILHNLAVKK